VRKKFQPKDIDELANWTYDPSKTKEKQRWESGLQNMSAGEQEKGVKSIFSVFGECKKIPRESYKTFDFSIDASKLVFDVTTINPPFNADVINGDPEFLVSQIRDAMEHAEEKDTTNFSDYHKGAVIYCSSTLVAITDLWAILENEVVLETLRSSNLDFVVFLPQESSVISIASHHPKVIVRKDDLNELFKTYLPKNYDVIKTS